MRLHEYTVDLVESYDLLAVTDRFKERRDEIQFQPTTLSERLNLLRRYGYTIDELENSEKQKKYELSSFRQIKKSCSKLLRSSRMMKTKLIAAQ